MFSQMEPRGVAAMVAIAVGFLLTLILTARARRSRYPAILYACAAYLFLLHLVWIVGLLTGYAFDTAFATLQLLTFPWSMAVVWNMTMVGFVTLPDLLLNYARVVLGFGGIQCLLITLFVWELKLRPRRR